MSDQNLTEAERWARECVNANACTWPGPVAVLLAEYDRRGAELAAAGPVVEAARALVEKWTEDCEDGDPVNPWERQVGVLLDQLAARVRALDSTTEDR